MRALILISSLLAIASSLFLYVGCGSADVAVIQNDASDAQMETNGSDASAAQASDCIQGTDPSGGKCVSAGSTCNVSVPGVGCVDGYSAPGPSYQCTCTENTWLCSESGEDGIPCDAGSDASSDAGEDVRSGSDGSSDADAGSD